MFKSKPLITVLAGFAGVTAVGTLAYMMTRRAPGTRARGANAGPGLASSPDAEPEPGVRESMVVARSSVADPLTLVLDLDGIFRGEAELEPGEVTVQCDVKRPPPTGVEDSEPPEVEDLGSAWLARATEAERSFGERDLDIDLDNLPDLRDEAEQLEDENGDEDYEQELTAASGWSAISRH